MQTLIDAYRIVSPPREMMTSGEIADALVAGVD